MPNIGETMTVETTMSKGDIESQVGVLSVIDSKFLSQVETILGGAALRAAGATLVGGTIALLSLAVLQEAMREQEASLTTSLQLIRDGGANGIIVTTPYIYMYMSGSGTGWYLDGSSSITTYWLL